MPGEYGWVCIQTLPEWSNMHCELSSPLPMIDHHYDPNQPDHSYISAACDWTNYFSSINSVMCAALVVKYIAIPITGDSKGINYVLNSK